jgi:hypothetical protein
MVDILEVRWVGNGRDSDGHVVVADKGDVDRVEDNAEHHAGQGAADGHNAAEGVLGGQREDVDIVQDVCYDHVEADTEHKGRADTEDNDVIEVDSNTSMDPEHLVDEDVAVGEQGFFPLA